MTLPVGFPGVSRVTVRLMMAIAQGNGASSLRVGKLFVEAAGQLARASQFGRHRVVKDLPCRSGYTVGCQVPSTKKASPSPGQGGIVAPSALRGSGPSLRN